MGFIRHESVSSDYVSSSCLLVGFVFRISGAARSGFQMFAKKGDATSSGRQVVIHDPEECFLNLALVDNHLRCFPAVFIPALYSITCRPQPPGSTRSKASLLIRRGAASVWPGLIRLTRSVAAARGAASHDRRAAPSRSGTRSRRSPGCVRRRWRNARHKSRRRGQASLG